MLGDPGNLPPSLRRGRINPRLLPILAVIGVIGVVGVFFFSAQLQQVKQLEVQLVQAKQHISQLESQNQEVNQQFEILLKERKASDERMASLRTQLASTTTDLDQARQRFKELQDTYEAINTENTRAQVRLATVTSERDETKQQLRKLETDKAELQRSVTRLRERLAWLDRDHRQVVEKLKQLEEGLTHPPDAETLQRSETTAGPSASSSAVRPSASAMAGTVELPPIIVHKDQAEGPLPTRGRIVEINEEHDFIIMDKGSQDGVQPGMTFNILRGNTVIGNATVTRVRPHLSACNTSRTASGSSLQAGDQIVQAGP